MADDTSHEGTEAPLVEEVLPRLAAGLRRELLDAHEFELADQVHELRVHRPCPCGDDFCQSFSTQAHEPRIPYGPDHRMVPLLPDSVMVNLDVVAARIVFIEIIV